ncbi:hypothetical protein MD484_g7522, partial [Candolleomyces efflorescens]
MECKNCELRHRQFYCRTCIKTHIRDFQSQHTHFATDLSSVVSTASVALKNVVEPARTARARVAEVRGRIDEVGSGLAETRRECEKKRDRIRKLREDLAQRRRTLGAARILVKTGSSTPTATSPPPSAVPPTPGSAPFLTTPLSDGHHHPHYHSDTPAALPPSPAHLALTQALARARSGLVQELVEVFNIVEVGGRPPVGGKAGTKGEWTIGGLVLPVPGDIRRYPPDHINAVLTLTIHFLSLLSFYLGIKLPFEVTWTGGKLGLGQPWIGAIRGGSVGGGDGGWGRWHKKHPLHLTNQTTGSLPKLAEEPPALAESTVSVQGDDGDKATTSSDDEDPMASSVLTLKGLASAVPKPSLHPIDTTGAVHRQGRNVVSVSNPVSPSTPVPRVRTSSSARPGPSPLSGVAYRRTSTLSLTSALAGVGGVVKKGVGGVVSAGAGVVGYGTGGTKNTHSSSHTPTSSSSGRGGLEESAFIVRSPSTRRSSSSATTSSGAPSSKTPSGGGGGGVSNRQQQEPPAHLSPITAPPSFTTGYTMLIYNVCYLAHTQRVLPEVGLSQAGEVLSNLWRCCCSAELGRVGHESVGWGPTLFSTSSFAGNPTTMGTVPPTTTSPISIGYFGEITSPLALVNADGTINTVSSPTSANPNSNTNNTNNAMVTGIGMLTMIRLPPPTPPTFPMDFGQLLQAVSGAGGAGARAKAKMRNVYTESQAGASNAQSGRRGRENDEDEDPWERPFSAITYDSSGKVHDDLRMAPSVGLVAMLRAMLMLQYQREGDPKTRQGRVTEKDDQLYHISEEVRSYSEEQFDALVEAAVDYCNDPRSASMKNALKASLSDKFEIGRCYALVNCLNTILLAFHDTRIGGLQNGGDFLYVVNDFATLKSASLSVEEDSPQAQEYIIRKPDILNLGKDQLEKLIPENQDFTFAQWVDFIQHRQEEVGVEKDSDAAIEKRMAWGDGSQCLKMSFREALGEEDLIPLAPGYQFRIAKVIATSATAPQSNGNRFGDRMRGSSGIKLEGETNGRKFNFNIPHDAHSGWELKARRRVTATPLVERPPAVALYTQNTQVANTIDPLPRDDELFFKFSWREHTQQGEGFIIQTARERAIQFLGENAGDVLNHLPDIKHSANYPLFSTGHIRNFLGLGFQGARVPSSLLSERLARLEEVDPNDFPKRIWEIIRCHYLLWQLGIAHSDVSLWNLMVRTSSDADGVTPLGVLNDFDLAAIMEPGAESPSKAGLERTGTKPFMAVDLLMKPSEMIKHLYAHDLESMIWCMVWYLEPQPDWTHGSLETVGRNKVASAMFFKAKESSEWAIENDAQDLWVPIIRILKQWVKSRLDAVEDSETPGSFNSHDHLRLFDLHMPYPKRRGKEDWDPTWMGWKVLTKDAGDILYMAAFGRGIIILGSRKAAVDLLDKRAVNFSDRARLPMVDMMDVNWSFGAMQYGAEWRQNRRAFHQYLNANAVPKYHPIMLEETKNFLRKIKSNSSPDQVFDDLQFLFGTVIMRTAYGFDDIRQNHSLIHIAERLILEFSEASVPGRYLVNYFPILKYVPSWFPGAGFQTRFKEIAQMSFKSLYPPFEEAKRDVEEGRDGSHPSMAHSLIDRLPEEQDPNRAPLEQIARGVCAVAYVAGAETTVSSATALLYVLASYPKVQAKAQAEIDAVVGSDRLPLVTDREHLPYVHAIIKEVSRWYTVVPLGVAHCNTEDDEYEGYFIPKETIILQNNWAIMHDPEVFDNPFEFIPERYIKDGKINPSVPDPDIAAFGHGRRICPGRHFSNDALFLLGASLLATYDIAAPKDKEGKVIPMKLELRNPAVSKPLPFKCEMHIRAGREHLLK